MLGDLIAQLDQPNITASVLTTINSDIAGRIERHAAAASMTVEDFVSGAVRDFVDRAGDDLWFQLLTIVRKSGDPGVAAVQSILTSVVTER